MSTIVEKFSYASIIEKSLNRRNVDGRNESREGSNSWTQTVDFKQAYDFGINGWDLGLEQYKLNDATLSNGSTIMSPSLAGCLPHVQNYIMDFPEQMYSLYDEREYDLPTLDIVVQLGYAGRVRGYQAMLFGKSIVNYINTMACDYNIRLTGVFASTQENNHRRFDLVYIKDFDNPLVLNNVAFAFHPSFFRRIWFGIAESRNDLAYGYGHAITSIKTVVKENLDGKSDKIVFFRNLQNLSSYSFTPDDIDYFTE